MQAKKLKTFTVLFLVMIIFFTMMSCANADLPNAAHDSETDIANDEQTADLTNVAYDDEADAAIDEQIANLPYVAHFCTSSVTIDNRSEFLQAAADLPNVVRTGEFNITIDDLTEDVRTVLEDFLSGFPSIPQGHVGWLDVETGEFFVSHSAGEIIIRLDESDVTPVIFMGGTRSHWPDGRIRFDFLGDGNYFDREGNMITESPFIRASDLNAFRFALYDIDLDGIPEILVTFGVWGTCDVMSVMFRLIDGAYREIDMIVDNYNSFFIDPTGRIIHFISHSWCDRISYYHLTFTNDGIQQKTIFSSMEYLMDEDWINHAQYTRLSSQWFDPNRNSTIYGTDMPLTRIFPLTTLQDEITASIMQKLR
ncbi:MAG: hypothetical protein FWD00_02705 [Clostridiales bacterium]|nr:hypothetical protein [Clostridiales bacterium]